MNSPSGDQNECPSLPGVVVSRLMFVPSGRIVKLVERS